MIEIDYQNQPTRFIQATYTIDQFDGVPGPFVPTWINHRWRYQGKSYRSLRLLKSDFEFKLTKKLASEISKEIDKEILNTIYGKA